MTPPPHNDHSSHDDYESGDEGPAENLDSVPDSQQERPGLDPQTQRLLDSLDEDDFDQRATVEVSQQDDEGAEVDTDTVKLRADQLERLSTAARQLRAAQADSADDFRVADAKRETHQQEASDGVPDAIQEQTGLRASDELSPTHYYYRLQANLPAGLQQMIEAALATIDASGPVLGLQIQAPFVTSDLASVAQIIDQWAREYLPLSAELASVHSEVRGAQQYMAGWRLDNASAWHQAQNDLTTRLAGKVAPAPNTTAAFRAIIGLLPSTPAEDFPKLVAFLHQQFQPQRFTLAAVTLLRMPQPDHASQLPHDQRGWQRLETYPLAAPDG